MSDGLAIWEGFIYVRTAIDANSMTQAICPDLVLISITGQYLRRGYLRRRCQLHDTGDSS